MGGGKKRKVGEHNTSFSSSIRSETWDSNRAFFHTVIFLRKKKSSTERCFTLSRRVNSVAKHSNIRSFILSFLPLIHCITSYLDSACSLQMQGMAVRTRRCVRFHPCVKSQRSCLNFASFRRAKKHIADRCIYARPSVGLS